MKKNKLCGVFVLAAFVAGLAGGCSMDASSGTASYRVSYDGNGNTGGAVPLDGKSYASGSALTVAGNTGGLVKARFTFAGWNTQADGNGANYTAGSGRFTITANTTLYARWTRMPTPPPPPPDYQVSYDGNGNGNGNTGGTAPGPTSYLSGTVVTVAGNTGNLVKTRYNFGGWNTQADGNGTNYEAGSGSFTITGNTTLFARWVLNNDGAGDYVYVSNIYGDDNKTGTDKASPVKTLATALARVAELYNSCYAKAPLSPVLKADSNSIALFSDAM
jgi:hypothetical protein